MTTVSKQEQILQTACQLFLDEGYRKVSIDKIVSAVPVSKPTLYAHFKDKSDLFRAVIEMRTGKLLRHLESSLAEAETIEDFLYFFGKTYLEMVMSSETIRMFRIISAECTEFPEMAELFYESGPRKAFFHFAQHIQTMHDAGTLYAPDPDLSADMFISTLKGKLHLKRLLGLCPAPTPEEIDQRTKETVRLFLAAHKIPQKID
jgi:TetR/AcrR family transcriptional repressor of mexJK operon